MTARHHVVAGGGIDIDLARHWSLRLIQLDYYLTRFDNGGNDHQNNLRVGVGAAFRASAENEPTSGFALSRLEVDPCPPTHFYRVARLRLLRFQ